MSSPFTRETVSTLLHPYVAGAPPDVKWPHIYAQLAAYLELILKWNAHTNLTAIRDPEEIIRRHFGESLFVGTQLGECPTLLDFGSGAGFPGIPIQILRPDIQVTLAESQGKKVAFLREAVRTLNLPTEVWSGRVDSMPASRQFHTVALRAVDKMDEAIEEAASRASHRIAIVTTQLAKIEAPNLAQFDLAKPIPLPGSATGILLIGSRI